jgi:hypothetical protein
MINIKIEMKTRIAAAEARCGPKQTNNNEGSARDLQIRLKKAGRARLKTCGPLGFPGRGIGN